MMSFLLALSLLTAPVHAQATGLGFTSEATGAPGAEYVSGNFPGAVLMPVNLWGAVSRSGIHHVPIRTDLVTLLSLAGGPNADAELDSVTIKRRIGEREEVIRVDAEELLTQANAKSIVLEANDIIVVPKNKPTVPSDLAQTLGFVGTILSIILAGVILGKNL